MVSEHYTRAGRGGMGAAKTGGNYASSLVAQQEAIDQGCDQVVFLDGEEQVRRGARRHEPLLRPRRRPIVTPADRHDPRGHHPVSIIDLAGTLGHQVEERRFSIDEWRDGRQPRRITEVFACGTAAVVTPVGSS